MNDVCHFMSIMAQRQTTPTKNLSFWASRQSVGEDSFWAVTLIDEMIRIACLFGGPGKNAVL